MLEGLAWVTILYMVDRTTGKPFATRSEVIAPQGMVATSHPLATQVGLDILKRGGSAVDAAIAANAALGLMEPTSNGIGGDLFAIVSDQAKGALHGLNASGRAPRSMTVERMKQNGHIQIPPRGPLSVTVPGAVDGWCELHQKFGRLSLGDILEPTINYARNGHPVAEIIAHEWHHEAQELSGYEGFLEQMTINGKAPSKGQIWTNHNLASTLQKIADNGRNAFYHGEIAESIGHYMAEQNGRLSAGDMAEHFSEWVEPVSTSYRGCEVWELPPNGQGIAVLQMLNLLEPHDISAMGFGSAEYIHLLVEAKKLAYEDRARLYADPAFHEIPVQKLISKNYAHSRGELMSHTRSASSYPAGDPYVLQKGDTIYLATADQSGNMVSLIQSNYRGMGSGMTPPDLGFVLHNRGEMFSLDQSHANALEPGKRPFHTIIPGFITRSGKPWMSFGVMGGDMQPQGQVQIIANILDFGMNPQEAGDAPRVNHTGSSCPTGGRMSDGGIINLETGFDPAVIDSLSELGHRIEFAEGLYGGYQAILRNPETGAYHGASESRKDGQAAGY